METESVHFSSSETKQEIWRRMKYLLRLIVGASVKTVHCRIHWLPPQRFSTRATVSPTASLPDYYKWPWLFWLPLVSTGLKFGSQQGRIGWNKVLPLVLFNYFVISAGNADCGFYESNKLSTYHYLNSWSTDK